MTTYAVHCEPKRTAPRRPDGSKRTTGCCIYVRASNEASAFQTAKRCNPYQHYKVTGPVRVATPQELGCVPTKQPEMAPA